MCIRSRDSRDRIRRHHDIYTLRTPRHCVKFAYYTICMYTCSIIIYVLVIPKAVYVVTAPASRKTHDSVWKIDNHKRTWSKYKGCKEMENSRPLVAWCLDIPRGQRCL